MGCNSFRFKQFSIEQKGAAMKVGTDGVLLGAWCKTFPSDKVILDIGTGTGLIALQLAQRLTVAHIDAVEIDEASARQARENFDTSEWGDRINLHRIAIQDFTSPYLYDHIVSNPPYFVDSLASADAAKNLAKHTGSLSFDDFISVCDRLLAPNGHVSLILPAGREAQRMIELAAEQGMGVSRRTEVHSTPKSGPKRLLVELLREPNVTPETSSLIIEDAGPGTFSAEYRDLTRDFYLYF